MPEVHGESPTIGSMLLAGVVLKLSVYGFLRFVTPLKVGLVVFSPLLIVIGVVSILHASFVMTRQVDVKRIVAYASVSHMNLVLLGIAVGDSEAFAGALVLSIGHAVVSAALFMCVG